MRNHVPSSTYTRFILFVGITLLTGACTSSDNTAPAPAPEKIQLTAAQVKSLDSSGQAIVQANPGNADLKSLVDSTLPVR